MKINSKYKKYIKLVIGVFVLCLGLVFMLLPFIPLGYIFVVAGLFLLAYEIPALKKQIDKLKEKDSKGRVAKVEEKLQEGDQIIEDKIIRDDDDKSS